jgi:hypothetical protein
LDVTNILDRGTHKQPYIEVHEGHAWMSRGAYKCMKGAYECLKGAHQSE